MHPNTATRLLTKRANDFLGMTFGQYILEFTHLRTMPNGEPYLWLNDNVTMQKAFHVWFSINDREAQLIAHHQNDN